MPSPPPPPPLAKMYTPPQSYTPLDLLGILPKAIPRGIHFGGGGLNATLVGGGGGPDPTPPTGSECWSVPKKIFALNLSISLKEKQQSVDFMAPRCTLSIPSSPP